MSGGKEETKWGRTEPATLPLKQKEEKVIEPLVVVSTSFTTRLVNDHTVTHFCQVCCQSSIDSAADVRPLLEFGILAHS